MTKENLRALPKRRAWRVSILDTSGIIWATSRGAAQMVAVQSYRDAYYDRKWPSGLRARRAPEYDGSYFDKGHGIFHSEYTLRQLEKEKAQKAQENQP